VRAVVVQGDRSLAVGELPDPDPGPGQVRVRVAACGICGSDLHGQRSSLFPAGGVFGHEFAGTVDAIGDGVEGWNGGERVCVFPIKPSDSYDLELMMTTGLA
jgi:threonine dehydrogenase-like Zn-dependent dehydrogenase